MTPPDDAQRDHTLVDSAPAPDTTLFAVRSHRRGAAEVLTISGELDLVTAPRLRDEIVLSLGHAPAVLVLDLSGLTFLASTGLSLLVEAEDLAKPSTVVRVVANQREVLRPIQATGLDQILSLFPTVDDALV